MAAKFEGFKPPTTKKIHIRHPGDPQVVDLPVNRHNYRSLDALLDDISHKVPRLNYGARRLYTAGGNTEILNLDQLEHDKSYICTDKMGNAKFKSGWAYNSQMGRERGTLPPMSRSLTNIKRETTTVSEKSSERSNSQRSGLVIGTKPKSFTRAKSLSNASEDKNVPKPRKPPVPKFCRPPAKPKENEEKLKIEPQDTIVKKPKKVKPKLEKQNSKGNLVATEEAIVEPIVPPMEPKSAEIVDLINVDKDIRQPTPKPNIFDLFEEEKVEKEIRQPTPKPKSPVAQRSPSEMLVVNDEIVHKVDSNEIHKVDSSEIHHKILKVDSIEDISSLPEGTKNPSATHVVERLNLEDSGSRPTTRQYLHGSEPDETVKKDKKVDDETDLNIIEDDGESIFTTSPKNLVIRVNKKPT